MKRKILNALGAAACACLFVVPMTAANKPATKANNAPAKEAMQRAWRPQRLSGRIMMVDAVKKIVVVKDADGVPFDMIVTPSTRIKSSEQRLTLSDLASQTSKSASVKFVPERRGDVAQSIRVSG